MLETFKNDNVKYSHNQAIDLLKGVCIIFVVFTHFSWTAKERLVMGIPFWIDMAVPIFMLISGYVNTLSYNRKQIKSFADAYAVKNWLKSFVRYTVPYLIIFLLEAVVICIASSLKLVPDMTVKWYEYITALFTGGWGQGSYYYPVLLQFLVFFPCIYFVVKKYAVKGLLACLLANLLWEVVKIPLQISVAFYRLNFFRYIYLVAFGVYTALYGASNRKVTIASVIGALTGILFLIVTQYLNYNAVIITYWQTTSVIAVMTIIPVFNAIVLNVKKVHKIFKPLMYLGGASYHIFLAQMPLSAILSNVSKIRIVSFLAEFIGCLVIGVIFYIAETPLTNKITDALYRKLSVKNTKLAKPDKA